MSYFPIYTFLSFSCLIALARTSKIFLMYLNSWGIRQEMVQVRNKWGESGPWLPTVSVEHKEFPLPATTCRGWESLRGSQPTLSLQFVRTVWQANQETLQIKCVHQASRRNKHFRLNCVKEVKTEYLKFSKIFSQGIKIAHFSRFQREIFLGVGGRFSNNR